MSKPTCRELLEWIDNDNEIGRDARDLAARVERVLALHSGVELEPCDCGCSKPGELTCDYCGDPWPCPTVRLLDGEEP